MLRSHLAATLLTVLFGAGLVPAAAIGASSLKITGKKHVKAGQQTTITISGQTSKKRGLAIYVDSRSCAGRVAAEAVRATAGQVAVRAVHGHFKDRVRFRRSVAGAHFICAYLYHLKHGGFVTDLRAGFRYLTK